MMARGKTEKYKTSLRAPKQATRPIETPSTKWAKKQFDSVDSYKQIWIFDSVDRDGEFSFDPNRDDMNQKDVLDKIVQYSARTWRDIKTETYGADNKTKHHSLSQDHFSESARDRIAKLHLADDVDAIFSMRLGNKTRIIGLRDGQFFVVKWFDPNHKFCPSNI